MAHVRDMDPGVPGIASFPEYAVTTYINEENISEDCLYLDIWVPDSEVLKDLPVYVYYHGGANFVSSGHFEVEDGANFAREQGYRRSSNLPDGGVGLGAFRIAR